MWRALRLAAFLLLAALGPVRAADCPAGDADFPRLYTDASLFERAIGETGGIEPANERLTGIVVPHHLTAARLIATGFHAASAFRYRRIVLLTPDHFFGSERPFATTARGFDTLFGRVAVDGAAAGSLLARGDLFEDSCLFRREHGVHALLPFLARTFPDTGLVPVAISIKAGRADWDRLAEALRPLLTPDTLVVQSTDFSHYLPHPVARGYDQQTLSVLASGSLDAIASLTQPGHADSVGALYVNTKLQREVFDAAPLVVANENMQEYAAGHVSETTSYVVALYGRFGAGFNAPLTGREEVVYLAGDFFVGRAMTRALLDEAAAERVEQAVLALTRGRSLVVNLEGVLLSDMPGGLEHMTLGMPAGLALDWLKRLNVVGVGLANNHVLDLGEAGLAETRHALAEAGIPAAGQGEALVLPGLDVVALTDVGPNDSRHHELITPALLERLARPDPTRPVVAFVHWGREYRTAPGEREAMLADAMRLAGATAIVGAHPHVASGPPVALAGGETTLVYSLGNFLFDQRAERGPDSLVELRVFRQGTVFARVVPLPNLYDLARGR